MLGFPTSTEPTKSAIALAKYCAVRIINAINPILTIHGDRGNSLAFPERKVDIWIFNVQKIEKGKENFPIKGDRQTEDNQPFLPLSSLKSLSQVSQGQELIANLEK